MDWWQAIAESRAPDFVVGNGAGQPYMNRWFVTPKNEGGNNVYLHEFIRDDDPRALHDHPWDSRSWCLSGCLREITKDDPAGRLICPGDYIERKASHAHRLEVVTRGFTLFITGPTIREWGFTCPQGWVHWKDFVATDDKGSIGRGCGEGFEYTPLAEAQSSK